MSIAPDVMNYAQSLFDHRYRHEIIPAHSKRLLEIKTKYPPHPQLPFSGADAQRLIEEEGVFAQAAAFAKAESLVDAVLKAGLGFSHEIFQIALKDTRQLLEMHRQNAVRTVLDGFTKWGTPPEPEMKGVLEQSIVAKMDHVYDNALGSLKIKLHESALTRAQQTPTSSKSKLVFLSHAAIDQAIAIRLKQAIENAIVGSDVFVSSDTEDLHPGDEWVGKIQEKLRAAKMLLILATDRSLNRPWVWFEAGAGWRGELQMIPCCLGSVRKSELSAPFSSYQALNVDEDNDLRALLTEVSRKLQLPFHSPESSYITAELQRLDRVAHDSIVSVFTPDEIQRRVDMVHVSASIQQGYAPNFVLLLANDSEETVDVKKICLLSEKIPLTEPHRLESKEPSEIEAQQKLRVDWKMQTNPADTLVSLHPNDSVRLNEAIPRFGVNIAIDVVCEVLGKIKCCQSNLRVQVDVRNHVITQIAG